MEKVGSPEFDSQNIKGFLKFRVFIVVTKEELPDPLSLPIIWFYRCKL